MFLRVSFAAALVAGGLMLAGPASAQNNATRGAIIGGVGGAVVGGAVTGRAGGAAVGAVVGGVTGAAIGSNADRRNRRSYHFWHHGRCYYRGTNGSVVRVNNNRCR